MFEHRQNMNIVQATKTTQNSLSWLVRMTATSLPITALPHSKPILELPLFSDSIQAKAKPPFILAAEKTTSLHFR